MFVVPLSVIPPPSIQLTDAQLKLIQRRYSE